MISFRPTIQSTSDLSALLDNIALLRAERAELRREQDLAFAAVREKFRAPLTEIERLLDTETGWAEAWARANRGKFSANAHACGSATLRFEQTPARLERFDQTWEAIAQGLAQSDWGRGYLRTPAPEIDKEAILASLDKINLENLRAAGLKIARGERFLIDLPTERPLEKAA